MNLRHMRETVPNAELVGLGRLSDYRFRIAGHGYASVTPAVGITVPGVVFLLSPDEERILDEFEGVHCGLYRKCVLPVEVQGEEERLACLVYVTEGEESGVAQAGYLQDVIAGAEEHGLAPVHLDFLRKLALTI